jgi:tetratricopeptide (TPR) repeat protein
LILSRVTLFKSTDKNKADTAFVLMKKAEELSNSLHYSEGIGNSLLMAALIYNYRNELKMGLVASQKALDVFKRSNNQRGIAEAYIIIGQHYKDNIPDEMSDKMRYYQMAVEQFIKAGAKLRAGSALQDLGNLYVMINKPQIALGKFHEAMIYYQAAGHRELQGLYDLIGVTSTFQADYVTGLKYEPGH